MRNQKVNNEMTYKAFKNNVKKTLGKNKIDYKKYERAVRE